MATYVIGDIQGCYEELRRLLERIGFDPVNDKLWLVGDLINRGPQSLQVLRFVKRLGDAAITVLGNHDLHLLALAAGNPKHKHDDDLEEVLWASDSDELIDWLRRRPVMHHDPDREISMIHAGLPPQWTLAKARSCAAELESCLRGHDYQEFLRHMYGNEPDIWSEKLSGHDRLRFITNCFTRLRYCDAKGRLLLKEKSLPGMQPPKAIPWFRVAGRRSQGERIVFGHWSTLDFHTEANTWAIDTGCVWGGKLTALRLRRRKEMTKIQIDCGEFAKPDG